MDLEPHLTNTSLQVKRGEEGVRLLDELIGCHFFEEGCTDPIGILTKNDKADILQQMTQVLAETFRAALQNPVHFQVIRCLGSTLRMAFDFCFSLSKTPLSYMV